jgi:hypothetical protein
VEALAADVKTAWDRLYDLALTKRDILTESKKEIKSEGSKSSKSGGGKLQGYTGGSSNTVTKKVDMKSAQEVEEKKKYSGPQCNECKWFRNHKDKYSKFGKKKNKKKKDSKPAASGAVNVIISDVAPPEID